MATGVTLPSFYSFAPEKQSMRHLKQRPVCTGRCCFLILHILSCAYSMSYYYCIIPHVVVVLLTALSDLTSVSMSARQCHNIGCGAASGTAWLFLLLFPVTGFHCERQDWEHVQSLTVNLVCVDLSHLALGLLNRNKSQMQPATSNVQTHNLPRTRTFYFVNI